MNYCKKQGNCLQNSLIQECNAWELERDGLKDIARITSNKGQLKTKTKGRDSPLVFIKYDNFLMSNITQYDMIDL